MVALHTFLISFFILTWLDLVIAPLIRLAWDAAQAYNFAAYRAGKESAHLNLSDEPISFLTEEDM
jgi:hypothetical protein